MNKTFLPSWAYGVLTAVGVVLIGSMFVNWIDVGWGSSSGFGIAWEHKHWLFLVPVVGALLVAAASTRSEYTRLAAVAAGVVVSGMVMFQFAKSIVFDGGVDTWLIFGGAGVILGGISSTRKSWRVAGGIAVLAGFFAPWDHDSMFRGLTSEGVDMLAAFGVTIRVLWLIPLAGVAAIASGVSAGPRSGRLALASGVVVFGSVAWVLGSLANLVLAWGAWAALGASALALVIGVLAPGQATRPALPAART
ncbi:MAG: hypothetical protein ABI867_36250 [Kofleriaceae bacterium]